jgi:hypothetical protein
VTSGLLSLLSSTFTKLVALLVTVASSVVKVKVKQSLYTPWRRLGGEEI